MTIPFANIITQISDVNFIKNSTILDLTTYLKWLSQKINDVGPKIKVFFFEK